MKGVIFDIKRFAVHDGPGIRVTVFLKGCPLSCWWCHNPESISPEIIQVPKVHRLNEQDFTSLEIIGREIDVKDLMAEIRKEQIFMQESNGGVTFSGGEPLLQHKFLLEMLKSCKSEGIHTVVDTSAYCSWEVINGIASYTDLFLIDLKMMDEQLHKKFTGVSNRIILNNIHQLVENKHQVQIRIPIIPTINDTEENIDKTIDFLSTIPINGVDLLPFHRIADHKYVRLGLENRMGATPKMSKERLEVLKQAFAHFNTKH